MDFSKEDWAKGLKTDGVKEVIEPEQNWVELTEDETEEPLSVAEETAQPEKTEQPAPSMAEKPLTESRSAAVAPTALKDKLSALWRGGEDKAAKTEDEKESKTMSLFEWMEAAIFALIAIALIFTFVLRTVGVDGESMNYTLLNGDKLLLSSWWYEPEHGDIVVVRRQNEEPLIKRVIACEGDRLDIDELTGKVILNGKELEEPYLYCHTPREGFTGEVIVPEGCVFVMGDNRINSKDSRDPAVGFVSVEDIMGKALWRIAPLDSFGPIYDKE